MARELTAISVFIASPGGLNDERKEFRDVIHRVNYDDAHDDGITFLASGWELTSAGVGRPQELINQQIRNADYLVVMLWDKWGRPPGGTGGYSSGTEEEFHVGLECLLDKDRPMRDIVVLFKGVNERQLADPGPDLQKVIAFKEELENERKLLFANFDSLSEFSDHLRAHLHRWMRDWRSGPPEKAGKAVAELKTDADEVGQSLDAASSNGAELSTIERAKSAAKRGRTTEAEQLFAQATTGPYDREAMTEYVRFLRKTGRLGLAQSVSSHLVTLARDAMDLQGEIEGLSNIALIKRAQGQRSAALNYWGQAMTAAEELLATLQETSPEHVEALRTKAFLLDNQALTLRRMPGKIDDAIHKVRDAMDIRKKIDDERGLAHTLRNLGSLYVQVGRLDDAETTLRDALEKFESLDYERGRAATLGALGDLYELKGEYAKSIDMIEQALALNSELNNPQGCSMNYAQLSRLALKQGRIEDASAYADECMKANQKLGSKEGIAGGLHALAKVELASGRLDSAKDALEDALALFEELDQSAGVAGTLVDLARVSAQLDDVEASNLYAARARQRLIELPHSALSRDLESVVEEYGIGAPTEPAR